VSADSAFASLTITRHCNLYDTKRRYLIPRGKLFSGDEKLHRGWEYLRFWTEIAVCLGNKTVRDWDMDVMER